MELFTSIVQPFAAGGGVFVIVTLSLFVIFKDRQLRQRRTRGELSDEWRLAHYFETIRLLWLLAFIALLAWALSGRDFREMGFVLGEGWRIMASWTIVGLIVACLILDFLRLVFDSTRRERTLRQLETASDLDLVRPENPKEQRCFQWVALSAGITEEIVFRGFLIASLSLAMPVWAAAILAGLLFIALHAYQGWQGMLKVALITLVLTGLYLLGGSLLPVIVLHILVDAIAGGVFALMPATRKADHATA